jgi:hypothetical protein
MDGRCRGAYAKDRRIRLIRKEVTRCTSPPARGRGLKHVYGDCEVIRAESPPARGRGLKLVYVCIASVDGNKSPPARGRGLKQSTNNSFMAPTASPPARGRGLKLCESTIRNVERWSPPARGRGLKQAKAGLCPRGARVAPRAGAWIRKFSYRIVSDGILRAWIAYARSRARARPVISR